MNILHLSTSKHVGGAARVASQLNSSLIVTGISSSLVSMDDVRGLNFLYRILNILSRLIIFFTNQTSYCSLNFWGLVSHKFLTKASPDIIHIHWIGDNLISLKTILRIQTPLVITFHDFWFVSGLLHIPRDTSNNHGIIDQWSIRLKSRILKKPNACVVFPSQWCEFYTKKLFPNLSCKTLVIPNAVNTAIFNFNASLNKLKSPIKQIALFVPDQRIAYEKGFDIVPAAFQILFNMGQTENIHIHLFGSALPKSFPVVLKTTHHGWLNSFQMASLYQSIDFVLISSRIETFGLVSAEALCCGTPVLAIGNTGVTEQIQDNMNGWICPNHDPIELANLISLIIEKPSLDRLSISKAAVKAYDLANHAQTHIQLYNSILKE